MVKTSKTEKTLLLITILNHLGKLDIEKLLKVYYNKESKDISVNMNEMNIESALTSIWKLTLDIYPKESDIFIQSGGNSLKALVFINHLEDYINKFIKNIKTNKMLDALFREKFIGLVKFIENDIKLQENYQNKDDILPFKRPKLNELTPNESIKSEDKEINGWISRFDLQMPSKKWLNLTKVSGLTINWKYNTLKCVDASPLLILRNDSEQLLIGSHSAKFVCVDCSGHLQWEFQALDRIESSATISKCKQYVIFGNKEIFIS